MLTFDEQLSQCPIVFLWDQYQFMRNEIVNDQTRNPIASDSFLKQSWRTSTTYYMQMSKWLVARESQ